MTDNADERVIAEWLGYKWVVPKNKYYDPQESTPPGGDE